MEFNYKARDKYGVVSSGMMQAENSRRVAAYLEAQGLIPISIVKEESIAFDVNLFLRRFERIKTDDLLVFFQQLSSILDSGVPLTGGLEAIQRQIRSGRFREIIFTIIKEIEAGNSFSDALSKNPQVFSLLIINMVRAGERAGILGEVLTSLANLLQREIDTERRIRAAVRYPTYVVLALSIGFVIIITFVVPRFASIFSQFGTALPLPTRILIGLNWFVTSFWYVILLVLGAAFFGFKKWVETPKGHLERDKIVLSVPVFGDLINKIILSRFCRMMAAMLRSGITIIGALEVSAQITDNRVINQVITNMRSEIIKGESFSSQMKGANFFPPVATEMVAIGEKTGKMEEMLTHVADYFDRETDYTIANLTSLIEPLLILVLGLVVLLFALGVFLPMWSMMQLFQQ